MLKNYIKIALRNITRNKGYSFINIFGLSVGLACSILVFLYLRSELSYDKFHENRGQLYRVAKVTEGNGNIQKSIWSQVPMGPAIEEQFPEVEEAIRFWKAFQPLVGHEQNIFNENGELYFTDPEVFKAFSFDLIKGNSETALLHPNSVVISKSAASKYFGNTEPIGQTLSYRGYPAGELSLTVTGVMRDLPSNSQFDFDLLVTMNGVETEQSNWGSHKPIWTYLMLRENSNSEKLELQLSNFLDSQYEASYETSIVELEPLTEVHLYSDFQGGFTPSSSITYIYLFGMIGLLILTIACINFMNLATARSINRATEIGIRKSFGAYRRQLIKQFIGETFILVIGAELIGLLLVELSLPVFNNLSGKALELTLMGNTFLLFSLPVLAIVVSFGAGIYPAFVLSGFNPVTVLRNKNISMGKGVGLRKILVVFQFAVSIVLIIGTAIVMKQMDYIRNKQLGFDKERIVVLPYSENEDPLIDRMQQHPAISDISVSQRVPVNTLNDDGRTVSVPGMEDPVGVESFIIDDSFLETYGIELLAGRGLSEEMASDSSGFLINEMAVKSFGWSDPGEAIGKRITWSGYKSGIIVGVVDDFHQTSLHETIEPALLHIMPESKWWRTFISVKISPASDLSEILRFLESTWKGYTPRGAYDYFFIDESLEALHREDQKLATIFSYVSGLAIFIACLGLLGLVSFMAGQRKKEIAIRKVLGASVTNILMLFNKKFLLLVLLGFITAVPIAIYLMNSWLNEFAYSIEIDGRLVIGAGILVLTIAFLIVSGQSIRAALTNPVNSLRSE